MIAIIDYGMGNVANVKNALDKLGYESIISNDKDIIKSAMGLILPGVGSFGSAMNNLKTLGLDILIKEHIFRNKPFLGVCLGLHLLFNSSEEDESVEGLSVFNGKVLKFTDKSLKIPHMGWNSIEITKDNFLLEEIKTGDFFYFVHSYYVSIDIDKDIISTVTEYGIRFVSGINKGNIFAFQFHPEKSQDGGLKIYKKFGELCENYSSN